MTVVHLVELEAYNLASSSGHTLRYTDMPAPTATTLDGRMWRAGATVAPLEASIISLGSRLDPDEGRASVGDVQLLLHAADEALYDDLVLDGRTLTIRRGQYGDPFGAYGVIFTGQVTGVADTRAAGRALQVTLALTSLGSFLDVPLLSGTYQGTGDMEGPVSLAGTLKPAVFGAAKNIELVQLSAATLMYQVHGYGAITAVTDLFQRAVSMGPPAADYGSYTALASATIEKGSYATCLAEGLVRLGGEVQEPLTADVEGDAAAGDRVSGILARMAAIAGVDDDRLDAVSFAAFDALEPAPISWVQRQEATFASVATDILRSFYAYWTVSAAGRMQLGRIREGGAYLDLPHAPSRVERVSGASHPLYERRLGYEPVWRVQRSGEYNEPVPGIEAAMLDLEALRAQAGYRAGDVVQNAWFNFGLNFWEGSSGFSADNVFINGADRNTARHDPVDDQFEWAAANQGAYAYGSRLMGAPFNTGEGNRITVAFYGDTFDEADGEMMLGCAFYNSDGLLVGEDVNFADPVDPDEKFGMQYRRLTVPSGAVMGRLFILISGHTQGVWHFTGIEAKQLDAVGNDSALDLLDGPAEPGATDGATFGKNTYDEDGLILVGSDVRTADGQLSFGPVWDFGDNSTKGWAASDMTLTPATAGLLVDTTTNQAYMVSPSNLGVSGAEYDKVVVRLKRLGYHDFDKPTVYYSTAGHGFSASYRSEQFVRTGSNSARTLVFDMANLTAGDSDWTGSVIDQIRFDPSESSGDQFEIDWIGLARVVPGVADLAAGNLADAFQFVDFAALDDDALEVWGKLDLDDINLRVGHQVSAACQILASGARRGKLQMIFEDSAGTDLEVVESSYVAANTATYQEARIEGEFIPSGCTQIRFRLIRESGETGAVGARRLTLTSGPRRLPFAPSRPDVEEGATNTTATSQLTDDADLGGTADYTKVTGAPTTLAEINAGEGTKLTGIQEGADVTNYTSPLIANDQIIVVQHADGSISYYDGQQWISGGTATLSGMGYSGHLNATRNTGDLADLDEVDTIQIIEGAVTDDGKGTTDSSTITGNLNSAWELASFTTAKTKGLIVQVSVRGRRNSGSGFYRAYIRLQRNTAVPLELPVTFSGAHRTFGFTFIDFEGGAGSTATYTVYLAPLDTGWNVQVVESQCRFLKQQV